jgi:putative ATPase
LAADDFADLDPHDIFQDGMDYHDTSNGRKPTLPTAAASSSSTSSSSFDQASSHQSRKEKANAAVLRSMPLAERARPTSLDDYIGQQELIGPGGVLRALVLQDTVP